MHPNGLVFLARVCLPAYVQNTTAEVKWCDVAEELRRNTHDRGGPQPCYVLLAPSAIGIGLGYW